MTWIDKRSGALHDGFLFLRLVDEVLLKALEVHFRLVILEELESSRIYLLFGPFPENLSSR